MSDKKIKKRLIPEDLSSQGDVIENILSHEEPQQKEKQPLDILGELFKLKEIESKTELTSQQVVLINQKRAIASMLSWDELDDILRDFMLLQISKNRLGRSEFVDAFKANREQETGIKNQGFFNGIRNRIGF